MLPMRTMKMERVRRVTMMMVGAPCRVRLRLLWIPVCRGVRGKLYYDTDYGSKSRGRQSQQEVEEEEREEEAEAQLIQRRLAQALQEDDFGVTWVEAFAKPVPQVNEAETRVVKDLAKVSVKEKLKMLRKESPELLELIDDLKVKLTEMKDELEPLLQLVEQKIIPLEKEANT